MAAPRGILKRFYETDPNAPPNLTLMVPLYLVEIQDVNSEQELAFPDYRAVLVSDGDDSLYALADYESVDEVVRVPALIKVKKMGVITTAGSHVVSLNQFNALEIRVDLRLVLDRTWPQPLNSLQDLEDLYTKILAWGDMSSSPFQDEAAWKAYRGLEELRGQKASLSNSVWRSHERRKMDARQHQATQDVLLEEIENLRAALSSRDHIIDALSAERRPHVNLPVELWNQVFQHALPSQYLPDMFLAIPARRLRQEVARILRCIVSVCKFWHGIGIKLLYEKVYLEHAGQLVSFADSLIQGAASRSSAMARAVHLLYLDFTLPRECQKVVDISLNIISTLCSHIEDLVIGPRCLRWHHWSRSIAAEWQPRSLFYSAAPTLRVFSIYHDEAVPGQHSSWLCRLLHASSSLVRLDLIFVQPLSTGGQLGSLHLCPGASFPQLEKLRLGVCRGALLAEIKTWNMPRVRSLELLTNEQAHLRRYLPVIESLGKKLVELHLRFLPRDYVDWLDRHELQEAIAACPALLHLSLIEPWNNATGGIRNPLVTHPTLTYIDVWVWSARRLLPVLDEPLYKPDGFPSLVRCRALDYDLVEIIPELPLLLPPQPWPDEDTLIVHNMLGIEVIEGPYSISFHGGGLVRDDEGTWFQYREIAPDVHLFPRLLLENNAQDLVDTDSDYAPASSFYSSETDSDRDMEWDEEPDEGTEPVEQLRQQEVLEIYRANRSRTKYIS